MKAYYSAGPGIREKIVSRFLNQIDLITLAFFALTGSAYFGLRLCLLGCYGLFD